MTPRFVLSLQPELRAVRHAYAAELAGRTELQRFLKQCLHDIRQVITVTPFDPSDTPLSAVVPSSGGSTVVKMGMEQESRETVVLPPLTSSLPHLALGLHVFPLSYFLLFR